jgi:hypothetical protein
MDTFLRLTTDNPFIATLTGLFYLFIMVRAVLDLVWVIILGKVLQVISGLSVEHEISYRVAETARSVAKALVFGGSGIVALVTALLFHPVHVIVVFVFSIVCFAAALEFYRSGWGCYRSSPSSLVSGSRLPASGE